MAIFRFNPTAPIPNNPFYSAQQDALSSSAGPLIAGSGININYQTGVISASGGGGGGGVTQIIAGAGLSGGTITSTGTISMPNVGVANTYTYPTQIVTDPKGRVTSITSGAAPIASITGSGAISVSAGLSPVVSVAAASTTAPGVTQLVNALNSSSTTQALTAAQGKLLQDQINALSASSNLILAGTFNAAGGVMTSVTTDGGNQGFTVGGTLPAPGFGIDNYFVIVTTPGSYSPPGGGGPYPLISGDWLLCNGTAWEYLAVGVTSPYASTTAQGSVCLATDAQAIAGINTTNALTPSSGAAAYVPRSCYNALGTILAGSSTPGAPFAISLGATGQVLTADTTVPGGVKWAAPATTGSVTCIVTTCGITGGPITTTGTIGLTTTTVTAGTYTNATLTVDAYGRLTAASSGASSGIPCACITGKGALISGTGVAAPTALPVGTTGQVLTVDPTAGTGLAWKTPASTGVTSLTIGTGLSGGPTITSTGTIALANTTVTAGCYTNATICVDAQGRLTAASCGTPPITAITGTLPISVTAGTTPTVSIAAGTTTAAGAVQLYNDVNSTCTTLALTAAQGKVLQDQINTLTASGGLTLAGTFDAAAAQMLTVTSAGSLAGFTVSSNLPSPAVGNKDFFVIVTTGGTYTPPGGTSTTASQGDWYLSNGTAWEFLNVGPSYPYATTSVPGIVCLSTNALVQAGTDNTTALTPATAASAYIPKTCITAKGAIITGTGASAPSALTVGANGQVLTACSTCTSGLTWVTPATTPAATPTVAGIILGCTGGTGGVTSLGFCATAGAAGVGISSVAIGECAIMTSTTPRQATAVGACALLSLTTGCQNTAVGQNSLYCLVSGQGNTGIGWSSLNLATGGFNAAVGYCAGAAITSGSCNVAIGPNSAVASASGSCQLAIGFSATDNWLTGTSSKAIKPGAGIIDCAGSCGTGGQVLMSNGANAICWGSVSGGSAATPLVRGTMFGCTTLWDAGNLCAEVALGSCAYASRTTGVENTAIGGGTLRQLTTGSANTALGNNAGASIVAGSGNVSLGTSAGAGVDYCCSVILGSYAAGNLLANDNNVILGYGAVNPAGFGSAICDSVIIGKGAGNNLSDTAASGVVLIGPNVPGSGGGTASNQLTIGVGFQYWLYGDSNFNIKPGAGIMDSALSIGTSGQFLTSTGTALLWSDGAATPTRMGTVYGTHYGDVTPYGFCGNIGFGCLALCADSATPNVNTIRNLAVGYKAAGSLTGLAQDNVFMGYCSGALVSGSPSASTRNVVIGNFAASAGACLGDTTIVGHCAGRTSCGSANALFGTFAGCNLTTSFGTTILGAYSGPALTSGNYNTFVGFGSGGGVTTGVANLALGYCATVPNATGSCQLAIGFSATCNWLTGCSDKSIQPGGGIRDCTGSLGTAGQVLCTNGSVIQWANASASNVPNFALCYNLATAGCWTATTTAPTFAGGSYGFWGRQLGPKQFEALLRVCKSASGTAGSGDYLFALPAGQSFNTNYNSVAQCAFTGCVTTNAPAAFAAAILPGYTGAITDGGNVAFTFFPVIYDATRFRLIAQIGGTTQAIGGGWFGASGALCFTAQFSYAIV